ncbi:hypothetical protein RRG08_002852 [Elysia crispata]|uniref:Uncharacterized protein n=1 Tax=Elysia crispata TaxID=231223 RepID=A0AAE0XVG8_9GAST|nr:hypothetical protein RRG08_002852 [Elysia crispata]
MNQERQFIFFLFPPGPTRLQRAACDLLVGPGQGEPALQPSTIPEYRSGHEALRNPHGTALSVLTTGDVCEQRHLSIPSLMYLEVTVRSNQYHTEEKTNHGKSLRRLKSRSEIFSIWSEIL